MVPAMSTDTSTLQGYAPCRRLPAKMPSIPYLRC
jgi:hypothetical protein